MIHVIFAGDSFSHNHNDDYDINNLIGDISFSELLSSNDVIRTYTFFALDIINQNKNIKIHTIGRVSYGNHVISNKFEEKVKQIQKEYPNDKIYGIIQFSGLVRQTRNGTLPYLDIDTLDYPYDYVDINTDIKDEKEIFERHFDNIEKLNNFCKKNNIKTYMYFGWANIFESDIKKYNLDDRIRIIESIVDFYKYEDSDDEMQFYCAGKKPIDSKSFFGDIKLYKTIGDLYGGLTEYVRSKLSIGKRYNFIFDAHPNTNANQIFYNDKIRKWLIKEDIINDMPLENKIENKIENIKNFEYIRFIQLIDGNFDYFSDIMNISSKLISEGLDPDNCKIVFYNLNKKIKNIKRLI